MQHRKQATITSAWAVRPVRAQCCREDLLSVASEPVKAHHGRTYRRADNRADHHFSLDCLMMPTRFGHPKS